MPVTVKAPVPGASSAAPRPVKATKTATATSAATITAKEATAIDEPAPTGPVSIRVTPSGKLYTYVRHALESLNEHPDQPVEIHTRLAFNTSLPPIKVPASTTTTSTDESAPHGLLPCTTSIPRLITVLEIIKREYLRLHAGKGKGLWQYNKVGGYSGKEVEEWEAQQRGRKVVALPKRRSGKGKGKAESGKGKAESRKVNEQAEVDGQERTEGAQAMDVDTTATTTGVDSANAGEEQQSLTSNTNQPPAAVTITTAATTTDVPMITDAPASTTNHADKILTDILNGGPNHIKMRHIPYMSVTLSTRPLPHLLSDPETSYQPVKPLGRRKARRAKRKGQALTAAAEEGGEEEGVGRTKKARLAPGAAGESVSDVRDGGVEVEEAEEQEEVEEVEIVEGSSDEYDEGETMEMEE